MDELLETFEIGRSLSMKGFPYDNAVAEATYKVMKTEFIYRMTFESLRHTITLTGLTNIGFMERWDI